MYRGARFMGMIVFIVGIALLVWVFVAGYGMFVAPERLVPSGKSVSGLGTALALVLIRLGVLIVMTIAGSLIAARGIHLYLGCVSGGSEVRREESRGE